MIVKKSEVNIACDIDGCKNLADISLKKDNMKTGVELNICKSCLEDIFYGCKELKKGEKNERK